MFFSPIRRSLKGFLLGSNYIGDLDRGFQGVGSLRNRLRPGSLGLQAWFLGQIAKFPKLPLALLVVKKMPLAILVVKIQNQKS